jgi:phosphoribosylglycinamide formyltransferase-1
VRVAVLASGRGSNFDALIRAASEPGFPARIVLLASDRADAPALEKARRADIPVLVFDPGTPRGAWSASGVAALRAGLAERQCRASWKQPLFRHPASASATRSRACRS